MNVFEDKIIGIIDRMNYNINWMKVTRRAIRGIIMQDGKYALIHSNKFEEYKFPGGGMEPDETMENTLIREVQEETGLIVRPETIQYYGKMIELQKGSKPEEIFEHLSYYFFCEVKEEKGARNLDDYEEEYEYVLKWTTLEEAIENNLDIKDTKNIPWLYRDTMVMQKLLDK